MARQVAQRHHVSKAGPACLVRQPGARRLRLQLLPVQAVRVHVRGDHPHLQGLIQQVCAAAHPTRYKSRARIQQVTHPLLAMVDVRCIARLVPNLLLQHLQDGFACGSAADRPDECGGVYCVGGCGELLKRIFALQEGNRDMTKATC
eukprot:4030731-Prymnesium_polylepis.2